MNNMDVDDGNYICRKPFICYFFLYFFFFVVKIVNYLNRMNITKFKYLYNKFLFFFIKII